MTELLRSFSRARAFIPGGATGLGRALALSIARNGGRVTVLDTDEEAGASLNQELDASLSSSLYYHAGSVANREDITNALIKGMTDNVSSRGLNLCVNCASKSDSLRIFNKSHGRASTFEKFWPIIAVNSVGAFNVLSTVVQFLEELANENDSSCGTSDSTASENNGELNNGPSAVDLSGPSRCVIINKTFLLEDFPLLTSYISSKGAVKSMTLPAARELSELGIRVCTISTGLFQTHKMEQRFSPAGKEGLMKTRLHPNMRYPQEEEFVHAVATIFDNELINGVDFKLDGVNRFMNPM